MENVSSDVKACGHPEPRDLEGQVLAKVGAALDAGGVGTWEWGAHTDRMCWRGAMERLHHVAPGTFGGNLAAYRELIHPDDREQVIATLFGAEVGKEVRSIEYRVAHRSEAARWVEAHARRLPDGTLVGVCVDAGERHRPDRELLKIVSDGFSVIDRSWRLVYVNEAGAQYLGLQPSQLIGRELWSLFPELVGTPLYERYRQAMNGGEPFTVEDYYYQPLGRWFASRVYPSTMGLVVHSQDVTERKRREALQEAHSGLRADVSAALASSRPLDDTMRACCEAAVSNLGVAFARIWLHNIPEQLLELRASAGLYTHIDGGHARVPVGELKIGLIAKEAKPHLTNDVQHDPRVGHPDWARREGMVSFAGYPLIADGVVVGVFAMFGRAPLARETLSVLGSISDSIAQGVKRRQAEAALEDRARELQRSNNDLEQFAYVASHDLQEPLRMVSNYLQLIERRYKAQLDAPAHEFIGFAVDGAHRMQRLINDLLSYSRVGRRGAAFGEVALGDALDAALADLSATIADTGATITSDPLPRVWADGTQLTQLLQNLIANALKFRGREAPRVHVRAERRGRDWDLSVQDNGIGIEAQYFERIFIIFQRLHGRLEYPGTGIGLAICKKIAERHGGRIWVESEPGKGSTFHITLPEQERTA